MATSLAIIKPMKNIDVISLNQEIQKFVNDREWDQFHSVKNLSMALNVEASELMEIFQWMKEEDSNRVAQNEELMNQVKDEVADVFVYLLRIVNKTGIDLEEAVRNKMQKNAAKYPVDLAKGNSRKYTEF